MAFSIPPTTTCLLLLTFIVNLSTACTDTVYIGTRDGRVAISRDGGATWSTVLNNRGYFFAALSADGNHVYAGATSGLNVSHDGGVSWSTKNLQTTPGCDSGVSTVFVDDEKQVYALIGFNTGCGRLALSSDNGNTWPTNLRVPTDPRAYVYHRNLYVDGSRIYMAADGNGLYYTDDLGASWTRKNTATGLGSDQVYSVIGRGQTIYAGLDAPYAPVAASWDGGRTWKTVNTTGSLGTGAVSMYLQDDTLFVSTLGGGLSYSDDFTNWATMTTADGLASNYTYRIIGSGNNLYLGTNGGLSISRDKGRTWIAQSTKDGLPSNDITAVYVQCV